MSADGFKWPNDGPDPQPWKRLPQPPLYRERDPMMPIGEPASGAVLALVAVGVAAVLGLFALALL